MKPVLMIHEVSEKIFDLPLEKYTLTFDDGLYSQYYYYPRFKQIPTSKLFFISSDIVCNGTQSTEFPHCQVAHDKAFGGNKEDYMTLEQIKDLMMDPMVTIGGHSCSHSRFDNLSLGELVFNLKADTEKMLSWFDKHLEFKPTAFCYPYNNDYAGMYSAILKRYGFTEFYGSERTPVETLLHN